MSACILTAPHNPTGWFPNAQVRHDIISLAEKNQCIVVADEVYAGLNLTAKTRNDIPLSLASLSNNVVSVGSLTKSFGLPGLRIGWVACKNNAIIEAVKNHRTFRHCYTSSLSEIVACSALKNRNIILQRNARIARKNLACLKALIKRWRGIFSANLPSCGTVCMVRFNPANTPFSSATELSADLLAKEKLVLLDDSFFDFSENWFRFGFATNDFNESLEIFEQYLKQNIK